MILELLLAGLVGVLIATQAGLTADLGRHLGSPLLATLAAFGLGLASAAVGALVFTRRLPTTADLRAVPPHLWVGGTLGALALAAMYWLIPRLGIGTTIAMVLCGQLALALVAGHRGWLGQEPVPLTATRALGAIALVAGILLIQKG